MEFVGSMTRDVNEANLARGQLGTRPKPRPERVRPRPRPERVRPRPRPERVRPRPRPERVRPRPERVRPRPKKFFEAEAKMYDAEAEALYSRNINHNIGTNCHKRSIISANVLTK